MNKIKLFKVFVLQLWLLLWLYVKHLKLLPSTAVVSRYCQPWSMISSFMVEYYESLLWCHILETEVFSGEVKGYMFYAGTLGQLILFYHFKSIEQSLYQQSVLGLFFISSFSALHCSCLAQLNELWWQFNMMWETATVRIFFYTSLGPLSHRRQITCTTTISSISWAFLN